MTYVQVPVPEEHVPAALEFVLSRVRATTPVEPQPDASITPSAVDDADDQLPALVAAVSGEARVLLETVARMPDTRMNYEKLAEVSGVRNVGAALQSLKIQRTRLGRRLADREAKRQQGKRTQRLLDDHPDSSTRSSDHRARPLAAFGAARRGVARCLLRGQPLPFGASG